MPDHTLEIEARVRNLASDILKRIGAEGKAAGDSVAGGMKKAEGATTGLAHAQSEAAKQAKQLRAGMAAMGLAMAAGGIEADSTAGRLVKLTSAGLGGYAMLGKVGAAGAVAAAGLSALASSAAKGAEEAKRLHVAAVDGFEKMRDKADASKREVALLKVEVQALKAELNGMEFDKGGAISKLAIGTQAEIVRRAEENQERLEREARTAFNRSKEGASFVETWFDPSGTAGGNQEEDLRNASMAASGAAMQAQRETEYQKEKLRLMKEEAELRRRMEAEKPEAAKGGGGSGGGAASEDPEAKAAAEREEALTRADEAWKEFDAAVQKTTPEYEAQAELLGRHLGTYERLLEIAPELAAEFKKEAEAQIAREKAADAEAKKREETKREEEKAAREAERKAEEAKRHSEAVAETNQNLADQVELLRAADEWERKRLEIHQDLRDLLANEETKANAQVLLAERLADLARQKAESDAKSAEKNEKAANEAFREAQAKKEADRAKDITQKFDSLGGGGMFGMGKGTPGFSWFDGDQMTAIAKAKAKKKKAGGGGGGAGGGGGDAGSAADAIPNLDKLPDPKPELAKAAAELKKIPPAFEKIVGAAKEMGSAATKAVGDVGKAAAKGDAALQKQISDLKERVRQAEAAIREASRGGGSGN